MSIPIKINDNGVLTWAIIEIQGDLLSRSGSPLFGQYIGDLHFTKEGAPILIIGHQLLHGKVVNLDKALAVLHRVRNSSDVDTHTGTEYIVKALVKKKLLFKTRPKPIISNLPKPK